MLLLKTKINTDDLQQMLGEHKDKMGYIAKKMMAKTFMEMRKEVRNKKLKSGVLRKKTGRLSASINYYSFKDFTGSIFIKSYKAHIFEEGPRQILPKKRKYLVFQINGEWKKVKKVTLPQKQLLQPVFADWVNGEKANAIMQKVMNDELTKIYNKAASK